MQKNVASQKFRVFAFDSTTGLPKSGDAANITAYISKDFGAVTVLADTSATEEDATNAKGYYLFDAAQAETNADIIQVTAKSSTSNVVVIGAPATIETTPANFTSTSIDSNGRLDVIKIAGTTQTARDIGASVLLSSGTGTGQLNITAGVVQSDSAKINGVSTSNVTTVSAYIGSTGAAVNGTNVNTLASHDPGATLASTTNITAGTITTATNVTTVNDKTGYSLSSAGVQAIWDALSSALTTVGSIGKRIVDYLTGDAYGVVNNGTYGNAAIKTVADSIKAKTDNLPAAPAATGDIAAAIVTYGLDHLVYTSVIGTDIADNSIIAKLASKSATADWDTYNNTTDSLEAIRDRGDDAWVTGVGAGTGARSVTITVNDGVTALQNAAVRMSQGAESYVVLTNASGVSAFALDDATWTVTVTKAGYTFTPTTIIVNGTETATYSMTAVTITPSDPGATTGYVTIRTIAGVAVSGAVVDVEVTRWANGTTGSGITPRMRSRTTDVNGYAEFTGLPRLATYRVRVNDGEWTSSAVTLDASTTPLVAPIGPAE